MVTNRLETAAESVQPTPRWRRLLPIAVLAAVGAFVLFYRLGSYETFDSHEAYAAVSAREMLDSGDWIVPRFGGLPRLTKPPLAYWVVATSGRLFGTLNEWTARVPSALSALLLALLVGLWAARWYGRKAGLAAAVIQMTAIYAVNQGRKAEVDMLLGLLMTLAMYLAAFPRQASTEKASAEKQSIRVVTRWTAIWAILGLCWLAKFHFGPAMVLAPCVLFFVIQRDAASLKRMFDPLGLLLFAVCAVVWPWLVVRQLPEVADIWWRQTFGRAVGAFGREPLWFYIPYLFQAVLPWTLLVLLAIPSSWRAAWKQKDPRDRFLWTWFLVQLAIVTLSAGKRTHYINPALPALAILSGPTLVNLLERVLRKRTTLPVPAAISAMIGFLVGGVIIWWAIEHRWAFLNTAAIGLAISFVVGSCAAVLCTVRGFWSGACVAAGLTYLGCYVIAETWIQPGLDRRFVEVRFVKDVRASLPARTPVCVYRMGMREAVFYLAEPVFRAENAEQLSRRLNQDGELCVVTYQTLVPDLKRIGNGRILKTLRCPANAARSKDPPMVLVRLTASPSAKSEPSDQSSAIGRTVHLSDRRTSAISGN